MLARALLGVTAALLAAWPWAARADERVGDALRDPDSMVILRHRNVRTGAFVVLRRTANGDHEVLGDLFVE